MNKSITVTVPPILACLKKAAAHLETDLQLMPHDDKQEAFVRRYGANINDVDKLTEDEMKSIADIDVRVVNKFLEDNGFVIRLPNPPPDSINVASVLNILVEWTKIGSVTVVKNDKGTFPAVKLGNVGLFTCGKNIVTSIETKSGFRVPPCCVWMTPLDILPDGEEAANETLLSLTSMPIDSFKSLMGYTGIVFPMIDYNNEIDLSWIEGLHINPKWFVSAAVQQTKFRMNEKGARANSGAGMAMTKGAAPRAMPFVIDKPFALWITRRGIRFPLFSGIFLEDTWKKPDSL